MLAPPVRWSRFALVLLVVPSIGCVTGFETDLGQYWPTNRSGWKKDEQLAPTFQTQIARMQSLRKEVGRLPQPQQQKITSDMSGLVSNSPNALLRAEAVAILAEIPSPEATQALRVAFNDKDVDVRIAGCRAWGRRGDAEALQMLSSVVEHDEDLDVRLAATEELSNFKHWDAVRALGLALDDKNPALQHRAVQSLKEVSGESYGDNVPAWREYVAGRNPPQPEPPSLTERLTNWF